MVASNDSTPILYLLPASTSPVEIPLTRGYVAIVDAIDADLAEFKWCVTVNRGNAYAMRNMPPTGDGKHRTLPLHRVILARMLGREITPDDITDHISGDTCDNRRSNLRLATRAENVRNKRVYSNNTSGFKGVSFEKPCNQWRAYVSVNGNHKFLGYYDTAENAAVAYNHAAKKQFGAFARYNDIPNWEQQPPETGRLKAVWSSPYEGISAVRNRWRVFIKVGGKRKHLGYFATLEDAYRAQCAAYGVSELNTA